MSISAVYTDANAKVTVSISGAPSNAQTALIERSTDQITWSTVRGATALTLSGSAAAIDDYEFSDGVANYYRATYADSTAPGVHGTPSAATVTTSAGASASVTPTMPTGISRGDVVFVAVANTKATATPPSAPTGWNFLALDSDGMALYTADWTSSLTIPAFTVTGLASGDKVVGNAFAYRNVDPSLGGNVQAQANASATNIAFPAFGAAVGSTNAGPMVVFQRSTHTSVSPAATYDDHATGYALMVYTNAASTLGGSITVTGGSAATSDVIQSSMGPRAFVSQETGSVTPALSTVWVINPVRPYLNRTATVIGVDTIARTPRTATFDVIARSLPVAVTDLMSGRTTTLTIRCTTPALTDDFVSCLTTGETQFIHAPKGARTPSLYCVFGEIDVSFIANTNPARLVTLPVTEVVAPSPVIAATLSSWQTVVSTYATWQDLINAKATWADVLLIVGSPTDLVTA